MYFAALLPELLSKNPVSFFFRHPVYLFIFWVAKQTTTTTQIVFNLSWNVSTLGFC
jgi:hypothetical protein